jgi:hypothetical protein
MMKTKKLIKLIILLLSSIIFISCLDIDSSIEILDDNSGLWILKYQIMQEGTFIRPGTELAGYNYLPLNETELRTRINSITGLNLVSFTTKKSIIQTEYLCEITFTELQDIELFFNNFTTNSLIQINIEESGIFNLIINNPYPENLDTETYNLFSALFQDNILNVRITLPGVVKNSNIGLLSDDPFSAGISLKILEILNLEESLNWIINYE